jgi:hypothetical protein
MAEEDSPPAEAEYGSLPVGPSLAWTHLKLSDVKAFMDIEKVRRRRCRVAAQMSDRRLRRKAPIGKRASQAA